MRTWIIEFKLTDDGKEGGFFNRKEIEDMVKSIRTAGLTIHWLNVRMTMIAPLKGGEKI